MSKGIIKKTAGKKTVILIAVLVIAVFAEVILYLGGFFATDPVVDVYPDNSYDKTLVVITDEDYRPYSFYDAGGNMSGHDVELITLIANEMQMNLDLRFMNWYEAIDAMSEGEADVLMTCDYSDTFQGVDKLTKSEPVSFDDFIVYSKTRIESSDELYGKRIAIMKNGNVTTQIDMMNLEPCCLKYDNNRQAMQALIDGEADYAIMRQTVGSVLLKELDAKGIKGYIGIGQSFMCFGISNEDPELASEINNTIEKLKMTGRMDELHNKWLTIFVRPYSFEEVLKNNLWVFIAFVALLVLAAVSFVLNVRRRRKNEEEQFRNAQVIEELARDFSCVNYVELTSSRDSDTVVNFRISEKLKELIPGWENEKYFRHKLELLHETLVYEPDREQFAKDVFRDNVMEALKDSDVYFVNTRFFIDGEIQYFQMKFSPVYENGKMKAVVAGLHSVDEQTKKELEMHQKLEDALNAADIANKSKTDFLFNMSHDIRTPMNAIMGFTNMAMKYIDDRDRALECLFKTRKSGNLLLSLINSILDVSRIESGNAKLDESPADVKYSFSNVDTTMQELAMSKSINLSFEVGDIKDRYIYCDINRCNRIFVNIVSNGIKYTKRGGYVKVRCEQIEDAHDGYAVYRYTFEDNGAGMSEEFQKHVFDKFSREETATVSGVQGSGLGMAVVKSFVELMGGTIECISVLGEGTTFIVDLPFRIRNTDGNAYLNEEDENERLEEIEKEVRDLLKEKRVLLVEDNQLNRDIALDILTDEGLDVETAEDGSIAVRYLEDKGPDYYDFILMDIQMPIMSGYEATKVIRKMYPDSNLPIIALSANAFSEDKVASIEAGMDDHVAKPINLKELFTVLVKYLK